MSTILKSYDAKIDSKKRITIRNPKYEYYHVSERSDGVITLEPRELIDPLTLKDIDEALKDIANGKVGKTFDVKKARKQMK